jgi:hypothetical protein
LQDIAKEHKTLATATYVSIAWMLLSWWPHDNMHIHNGGNLSGIIKIDYGFHATLILAACIVAWYFFATMQQHRAR